MAKETSFEGPIFVVGMPRSGTKLMREILNHHSMIAIPSYESHSIPYFHKRLERYGDLSDRNNFRKFFGEVSESMFFKALTRKHQYITEESWFIAVDDFSYAGVMGAFYREYSRYMNKRIWGDKTPYYLVIIPLLKELWPEAKIVHIIRDARDCCLSLRNSFYNNIYRSAQKWHDTITRARKNGRMHAASDYYEVFYEKLLDEPEEVLKPLCEFLEIPYESGMSELTKPTQYRTGDAADYVGIMKKNYRKWEKAFSAREIRKMEIICGGLLSELGYPVSYKGKNRRLNTLEANYYKFLDGFNLVRWQMERRSFSQALWRVKQSAKYLKFKSAEQPGTEPVEEDS